MTHPTTQSIDQQIEAMAEKMGVSASDVRSFATSMCAQMIKDKLSPEMINPDNPESQNLIQAYAVPVERKFHQFQVAYLTQPAAKQAFQQAVRSLLQGGGQ